MSNKDSIVGELILKSVEEKEYFIDIINAADDELEHYKNQAQQNNHFDFKSVNERTSREILAGRTLSAMKSQSITNYDSWKKVCSVIDFFNSIAHAYRANRSVSMGSTMYEESKKGERENFYEKNGSIFALAKLALAKPNQVLIGLSEDEEGRVANEPTLVCDIPTVGQVAWHIRPGVAYGLEKFCGVQGYPFPIKRRGDNEAYNIQVLDPSRNDRLSMHNIIVRDSKSYEEMINELNRYYFPKRRVISEFTMNE